MDGKGERKDGWDCEEGAEGENKRVGGGWVEARREGGSESGKEKRGVGGRERMEASGREIVASIANQSRGRVMGRHWRGRSVWKNYEDFENMRPVVEFVLETEGKLRTGCEDEHRYEGVPQVHSQSGPVSFTNTTSQLIFICLCFLHVHLLIFKNALHVHSKFTVLNCVEFLLFTMELGRMGCGIWGSGHQFDHGCSDDPQNTLLSPMRSSLCMFVDMGVCVCVFVLFPLYHLSQLF